VVEATADPRFGITAEVAGFWSAVRHHCRSEEASRETDQTRKSDRISTINKIQTRTRHQEVANPVNLVNPVSLGNQSRQQYVDIPIVSIRPTCPLDLDLPASRPEFPNQPVEATATCRMRFGVRAGDRLGGSGRRASPFRSEEASGGMAQTRNPDRINTINRMKTRTGNQEAANPVNLVNPVSLGNESRQQYVDIPVGSTCATCALALDLPGTQAEFPNQPVEATATRRMRFVVGAGDLLGGLGRRASPVR
jgi:hypothetical protein